MKGTLIRELTKQECHWLSEDLPKGKIIYKYSGCTYGVLSKDGSGVAVSDDDGETPFYEIPKDAVAWE